MIILRHSPGLLLRNNKFFGILIFLIGLLFGCGQSGPRQAEGPGKPGPEESSLPADFKEFYARFEQDSLFQMEHIDFPLKGLPDHADPDEKDYEDFYYTADQWDIHKPIDYKKFDVTFVMLAEILIEERIVDRKYQLTIVRRFAKGSGGWRLIYYAGLNSYKSLHE